MKKYLLLFCILFTACSSPVLPDKNHELSEFLPISEIDKNDEILFDFADKNFPEKCEWKKFNRVIDGDTIEVGDKEKVRFVGIDTPEIKHPTKDLENFGLESSAKTKELLENSKQICLIYDSAGDKIDKYGRTLSYIFSEDGIDVNAELLKIGFAKGYFYFPFSRKEEFRAYEKKAKDLDLGLWAD